VKSDEAAFPVGLFRYDPTTGAIFKGARRRDYADGYRRVCEGQNRICAHRLAWRLATGEWPSNEVDHINRDRSDNRWSNLRSATASENQRNSPAKAANKTGERGVLFDTFHARWKVSVGVMGRRYQRFAVSKISAILAARIIRRALHGEFAYQPPA